MTKLTPSESSVEEVGFIPARKYTGAGKYEHLFKQLRASSTGILKVSYEQKSDARMLAQHVKMCRRDISAAQRGSEVYLSISEGGK